MKSKLIHAASGQRTFAVVFDVGDDPVAGLKSFAGEQKLAAAQLTAIGAFRDAVLAYFNWETKQYNKIPVSEQVEVLTLVGDIALKGEAGNEKPEVHAHVVLGRRDGSTVGGHLMSAHVRPTLEVILTESPAHLHRRHDERTGLALIRL